MNQTEARNEAKRLNLETGLVHVATTVCARRGQFEQGPDANTWIVVSKDE